MHCYVAMLMPVVLFVCVCAHSGAMVGFEGIAYEYAVEMTYPLPEVISTGYLNCLSQVSPGIDCKLRRQSTL